MVELQSINVKSRSYREELIDIDLKALAETANNPSVTTDGVTITGDGTPGNPLVAAAIGSAVNYANVYFVDTLNGNDSTAVAGDFTKPYLSLGIAILSTALTPGTLTNRNLVWVRKGEYASVGNIAPIDNCDVYCDAGVVFTGYFSLSDLYTGSAVNFNWYGFAKWNLSMSQVAFRWQYASNVLIEGDSFVNTGAISLAYNVTVGTSNITYNFNSMESTQTLGNGYAFSWRNNCNGTVNVKNYIKSPHSQQDIRASHSGNIQINCPRNILTDVNIYGGNFKQIAYVSSSSLTSTLTFNGLLINETVTYLVGISTMILYQGLGTVIVKDKIYANQGMGVWNTGAGTIIAEGGIESNIQCFVSNGVGTVYIKRGLLALKSLGGSVLRLGYVGAGNVWLTDVELNSDLVGDCILQATNTSKVYMKNVTCETAGTDFIKASVAGTINQFTNCVSNKPLSANVTNELAQGLTIDALLKTPKY
jgi:hypothetical protein